VRDPIPSGAEARAPQKMAVLGTAEAVPFKTETAGSFPGWFGLVKAFAEAGVQLNLGLGGGQGFETGVEAALVAGDGVGVEDALLHALVEDGDGDAVLGLGGLDVALDESLAQGAQAGTDAAAVGAVDFSAGYGLAGALERRNMVCHCSSLIF
jgi:hypothetical protein